MPDTSTNTTTTTTTTTTSSDAVSATSTSNAPSSSSTTGLTSTDIAQGEIVQESESVGKGAGLDKNSVRNKGVVFPVIRINDHYFTADEISEFYIESGYYKNYHEYKSLKFPMTGFVPTMYLVVTTASPDLLKDNQIKSGDKCAVFFSNGGGMVKSYRADYLIQSVVTSDKPTEITDLPVTYIIRGELYVPKLRDESEKFNFNGSSRDAMMDCASRLGLGFFFCDPDDTADYQGWVCGKNLLEYALDVSSHAWKEFNSFYDAWIDPRYGLSFINMNKMLIVDGFDEPLDFTPFVNMINSNAGIDGSKAIKSEEQLKAEAQPQAKLLTNIPKDDESVTPFYIKKWNIVNKAAQIAQEIGINQQETVVIDNPGVQSSNTDIDMNYSIPINTTKLQNGFFVLMGPGVNLTYTQADQVDTNQSFVKRSYKVSGGQISEVMSNDDATMMAQNGNNMFSSGNTNRFYDTGWEHNMRNNLQLQKQYTEVELQGLNLAIMRGEKLPVLIVDNDRMQASIRAGNYTGSTVQNALYEMASGWYVIDGLMWHWAVNEESNGSTLWTTKLKLVRREWPIPGRQAVVGVDANSTIAETTVSVSNASTGSTSSGTTSSSSSSTSSSSDSSVGIGTSATTSLTVTTEDATSADEMPLTGLKENLKTIYYLIKNLCPNIKLVSARRWAVDENGNRVEGNAYVTKNGMYKCVNAKGEIMYFKSNNSKHLYGEAIDIINKSGQDFNEIMTKYIMLDNNLLNTMATYGYAACIEQTTDDTGVATMHYHIGTEKTILKTFWEYVLALNTGIDSITRSSINSYLANNAQNASAEIKHEDVEESS